jgi:hypothetical protein
MISLKNHIIIEINVSIYHVIKKIWPIDHFPLLLSLPFKGRERIMGFVF